MHPLWRHILHSAHWANSACTWIGWTEDATNEQSDGGDGTFRTLDASVYEGTAGVALAAALSSSTDRDLKRLAAASARHALSHIDALPTTHGYYTGRTGSLAACAAVAKMIGDHDLYVSVRGKVKGLGIDGGQMDSCDLLAGGAGTISALLILADLGVLADGEALARRLAFDVCEQAARVDGGLCWRTPAAGDLAVTGVAHGASGIASSLLQCYLRTGDERLLDTAEGALAFERRWFSADKKNWADLRLFGSSRRQDEPAGLWDAVHWCYGAPGIALTRLFAWRITGRPEYESEARIALEATVTAILSRLRLLEERRTVDASLCHGLAGLLMILDLGAMMAPRGANRVRTLARKTISYEAIADGPLCCGTSNGAFTFGVMRGLSGIAITASPMPPDGTLILAPWAWSP